VVWRGTRSSSRKWREYSLVLSLLLRTLQERRISASLRCHQLSNGLPRRTGGWTRRIGTTKDVQDATHGIQPHAPHRPLSARGGVRNQDGVLRRK
jgi:hypothetical protein